MENNKKFTIFIMALQEKLKRLSDKESSVYKTIEACLELAININKAQ